MADKCPECGSPLGAMYQCILDGRHAGDAMECTSSQCKTAVFRFKGLRTWAKTQKHRVKRT